MAEKRESRSFRYGEGKTGSGQAVCFSYPSDTPIDGIRSFLEENIHQIDIPTTGRVNIGHGGYGQYTRYDVVQHKYAGGGHGASGGYIEVLEIKNPPENRWGIVINEYRMGEGSMFTEWKTIKKANAAFEKRWSNGCSAEKFSKLAGFKRRVECGPLTPWFYAIGDELLVGDYAFPDGLQDDAVFRVGKKFVVFDDNGSLAVKTCMGTRFVKRRSESGREGGDHHYRMVSWDDGSVWDESKNSVVPRSLGDNELWVAEAVEQFRQLLTGKNTEFTVNFTDGNKFVGKFVRTKCLTGCAEGK